MAAGRILLDLGNPALDGNADPQPNAKRYFYLANTTTPQDTFTDNTLTTPHPNPLIADGVGRFPTAWGDITAGYDVKWTDADDALIYTFESAHPTGKMVGANGDGVSANAFRTALGLGTAALEDIGDSGNNVPLLSGDNTWSGIQTFTADKAKIGTVNIGYLGIPLTIKDEDYTFASGDEGKGLVHDDSVPHTWTIPPNADEPFEKGTVILVRNRGTGAVTLARGSGVTLRMAGDATNQDVDLASYGAGALIKEFTDIWYVQGAGLS